MSCADAPAANSIRTQLNDLAEQLEADGGSDLLVSVRWVRVPRIGRLLERSDLARERLLALLGPSERQLCLRRRKAAEAVAARLAAKRALVALLRRAERERLAAGLAVQAGGHELCGDRPQRLFPVVELSRTPLGQPELVLPPDVRRRLQQVKLSFPLVSLTHDSSLAGALVAASSSR